VLATREWERGREGERERGREGEGERERERETSASELGASASPHEVYFFLRFLRPWPLGCVLNHFAHHPRRLSIFVFIKKKLIIARD
jgi:hypothetical protein